MKKINVHILKLYSRLLAGLLFIFGITSCETTQPEYGGPVAMYGVIMARYKISGNVKSDSTNNNIPQIKVSTQMDSTYSDANGNYQLEINDTPGDRTFTLHFKDTDGTLNGAFQNMDTTAVFTNPQFINGDGNFDAGETSKVVDVKLKPE